MTNIETRKPFGYKQGYSVKIASGAVDTQLVRMPWAPPVQRPGYFRKIMVTSPLSNAGRLDIWDQDLSNTTPPTAGSAGAAIYSLEIAASALSGVASKTTIYIQDQLPQVPFVGGAVAQSTLPGVTVDFEIEYI